MCKNQNIVFWICAAGEKGWKCFTLVKVCRILLNSLFLLLVLSLCGSKFQFSAASGEVFFCCFLEEQITFIGFQLILLSISIFQRYLLWYVVSTVPSVEISLLFNSTQSYQLLVQKTDSYVSYSLCFVLVIYPFFIAISCTGMGVMFMDFQEWLRKKNILHLLCLLEFSAFMLTTPVWPLLITLGKQLFSRLSVTSTLLNLVAVLPLSGTGHTWLSPPCIILLRHHTLPGFLLPHGLGFWVLFLKLLSF